MKKIFKRFAFASAFLMIYVNACADALDDFYQEFYQECFPDSVKIIKDSTNVYFEGTSYMTVSTYEYNANGLITVFVDNYEKGEYAYDINGNLILEADYSWSAETNSWVGRHRHETTYDANGNSIFTSIYNWDTETNMWMIRSYSDTTEYTYDAIGNKTLEVRYNRDKHEYTYDANGNLTISVDYIWDYPPYSDDYNTIPPQTWIKKGETEYTYDTNGNLILEADYYLGATATWVSRSKIEYTYDANGKVASIVSYEWDSYKDLWRISTHAERTANGDTALLYITHKDEKGNEYEKYKYECTTNGNLTIFSVYYTLDSQTNNWILSSESYVTTLTKEENNQKEEGGNENQNNENQGDESNNGENNNNQNSENQSGNNGSVTDPVSAIINQINNIHNIIHSIITDVDEEPANEVNIYAHHNTIIVENATEEIRVYNAMGAMVGKDEACRVRTKINVNGTGVYIVKVGTVAKRVMIND